MTGFQRSAFQDNAFQIADVGAIADGSILTGAGPIAIRRRGKTAFDDWSLMMDDEAILELYAIRKTR